MSGGVEKRVKKASGHSRCIPKNANFRGPPRSRVVRNIYKGERPIREPREESPGQRGVAQASAPQWA